MNSERGVSSKLRRLTTPVKCLRKHPRGSSPLGRIFTPQTSHEGNWCQASMHCLIEILLPLPHRSPRQLSLFLFPIRYQPLTDVGPVELWATR